MKSAIINFGPGGSTGRIGQSLYNALYAAGHEAVFCYGYEANDAEPPKNSYRIGNRLDHWVHFWLTSKTGLQGFFSVCSTIWFLLFLKRKRIDTFFLIDIHGSYLNERLLFRYIKKHGIRCVYIMIDEYAMLGRCCYSFDCERYQVGCGNCPHLDSTPSTKMDFSRWNFKMKQRNYKGLDNIVFVAPECVISKAKSSFLLKNKPLYVLDEAIDVTLFSPRNNAATKQKLGLPEDKILILCVAPMSDERKGCIYYLNTAKSLEQDDRFLFVHIGCDKDDVSYPTNYKPIPFVKDLNLLADYMSCAELFVFPSLADSMPSACIDALACGTPLLCFDLPGMACLGDETVMTLVPPKNINALRECILGTTHKNEEIVLRCREYAEERYDSRKYNSKLIQLATSWENR